jgi:hypothetical protein
MHCPVCRAENTSGPTCRRCKADLSLLFALEDRHAGKLAAARRCLAEGKWQDAAAFAEQADGLRHDDESRQLLAVAWLLRGDFSRALQAYGSLNCQSG